MLRELRFTIFRGFAFCGASGRAGIFCGLGFAVSGCVSFFNSEKMGSRILSGCGVSAIFFLR